MQGSLQNWTASRSKQPSPEVGMGCTVMMYTDRHAATIVAIDRNGKRVGICRDNTMVVKGSVLLGSAEYTFKPITGGWPTYYTLRKDGTWVREGNPMRGGQRIAIGYRSEYYDPHF